MKKNKTSFTNNEIDLLKQHLNLAEVSREFDLDVKSRYIYRIMRNFPKTKGSRAYLVVKHLQEKLNQINAE